MIADANHMGDQRTKVIKQDNNGQLEKEETCFQSMLSFAFHKRWRLSRSATIQNGKEQQNKSKFFYGDVILKG